MTYKIIEGDVVEALKGLPEASVQCCVTSPPYWGLRDYGVEGQIGLEDTPQAYVERMVDVFKGVKRVLRDDGTMWLNVGVPDGLKPKDLCLIPYRLILALQDDGWWVRSQIVWAKKSAMPESVKDRPTSAWEPIFLLSKSQKYYYDKQAVMVPAKYGEAHARKSTSWGTDRKHPNKANVEDYAFKGDNSTTSRMTDGSYGSNLRNVWHLGPEPCKEAHFATFPTEIPRRAILAGAKKGDTVLDPFAGSGTTLMVAEQLGRDSIGIELNPEYAAMAEMRIQKGLPLTQRKSSEDPKDFGLEMT